MRLTAGSKIEFLLLSSPAHLGFSLLSPTVVLSPLLRHLYQNATRIQHRINPKMKHGTVMNTQGNGVVFVGNVMLGLPGFMPNFMPGVPLCVTIGEYPIALVIVSVALSVNRVAMEVMAEVALKVCALFIEDPGCARR